eukprot:5174069-Amphidinium_carterae.1
MARLQPKTLRSQNPGLGQALTEVCAVKEIRHAFQGLKSQSESTKNCAPFSDAASLELNMDHAETGTINAGIEHGHTGI